MTIAPLVAAAFTPTGPLRAAINLGNPILAGRDAATGAARGVSVDLAHEFARQLGVAVELVVFDTAGQSVDAVTHERADIGFFAIDPLRGAGIAFTAAYVLIEGCYLVRETSPLHDNAEVDRAGHTLVVGQGSAYDLHLSREIQHASLLRAPSSQAVVDTFVAQQADVAAGVKQQLQADAARIGGLRLLPGRFMVIQQAMGLPKGRGSEAAAGLAAFVEAMKASGFVADALARHGIAGASVAPPAQTAPTMLYPTRNSWRRGLLALLAALAVQAPPASAQAQAQAPSFTAWSESFAADWVRLSAERATFSQYFGAAEQAAFDRQLTPITPAQRDRRNGLAREGLARLATFDDQALSADERVGAGILRWQLQRVLAGTPYEAHNFIFNQLGGPHIRYVSLLAENQPLSKPADVDAFLSRLQQVPARLDESLALAREAAAKGLLPPRFILERARTQVQAFLDQGVADNDIVAGLARRSARIEGLPTAERQAAIDKAQAIVAEQLRPAYQRVLVFMNELHPRTTADAGLWRLPAGDKAYAEALAQFTTTPMTAEQIHATGLREVARIEAEMDRILQGMGRKEGSVQARLNTLRAELQPPPEPDPRPALIERYAAAIRDAQQRADALFNLRPRAPVEVRRVPALTERTASAFYTTPTPDGSRPGIFWAPLPGPSYDVLRIRSLAVHEAVPGHHFQLALQQEQADLPRWRQRRVFGGGSAHSEGWALYAERLALENGWYDGDAPALLGAWDGQLFRARRLVVDTGLHAKRWTREQAIAYGLPAHEVERYVANPGQATAYMVGMLHILALRDEARALLGERFQLKAFHDVVLKTGSVPLDVLSDVVRRWAKEQAK